MTTPTTDARIAARRPSGATSLRLPQSALRLLREHGADAPQALTDAMAAVQRARLTAAESRSKVTSTLALADEVLAAATPARALADAGKRLASERASVEVADALVEAATRRALAAFRSVSDEIVEAVLGSEATAQAFADLVAATERVPADAVAEPESRHGVALVAAVMDLRHKAEHFERLLSALVGLDLLPDYGLPGAYALLFADPAGADPAEVRRRLRGLRPGALDVHVWTSGTPDRPIAEPLAAPGVPAALLAGLPGVVLSLATTAEEIETRARRAQAATVDEIPLSFSDEDGERVTLL